MIGKHRKKFTPEEDEKLMQLVNQNGPCRWKAIAAAMGGRNGHQCRDRYVNYLRPNINKSKWNIEEDRLLISKFYEYGPRWSLISNFFVGRTSAALKNRWYVTIMPIISKNGLNNNENFRIGKKMKRIKHSPKLKKNLSKMLEINKNMNSNFNRNSNIQSIIPSNLVQNLHLNSVNNGSVSCLNANNTNNSRPNQMFIFPNNNNIMPNMKLATNHSQIAHSNNSNSSGDSGNLYQRDSHQKDFHEIERGEQTEKFNRIEKECSPNIEGNQKQDYELPTNKFNDVFQNEIENEADSIFNSISLDFEPIW